MQKYNDISNVVDIKELKQKINENFMTLKSNFSGNEFPSDPVIGQICVKSGIKYIYSGSAWNAFVNADHDHNDIYYTEDEIDALMSQKLSTSGTAYNANTYRNTYVATTGHLKNYAQYGETRVESISGLGLLCVNYNNYDNYSS